MAKHWVLFAACLQAVAAARVRSSGTSNITAAGVEPACCGSWSSDSDKCGTCYYEIDGYCGSTKNSCESCAMAWCDGGSAPPPPSPPSQTPSPSPVPYPPSPPGQDATAYWKGVNMASKSSLQSRMRSGHKRISYGGLWDAYKSVWVNLPGQCQGSIYDIYSLKCWTPGDEQCGSYRKEGDCYNREHSWPKSWWGGAKNDAYSDMFHVMPSDGYVNGKRSALPFGEVGSTSYVSSEGHKVGSCSAGTCFEPTDRTKGLVARGHLYMTTRYSGEISGSDLSSSYRNLMVKWHKAFPPTGWEQEFNNRVHNWQGNRNAFIDYPDAAVQSLR